MKKFRWSDLSLVSKIVIEVGVLAADGLLHQQRRAAFAQGAQAQRGGFHFRIDRRHDLLPELQQRDGDAAVAAIHHHIDDFRRAIMRTL